MQRAGSKWKVHVAWFVGVPGGTAAHREQVVRELLSKARPQCNAEQYDHALEARVDRRLPGPQHHRAPSRPLTGRHGAERSQR